MAAWKDDLVKALEGLGGQANLEDIYKAVGRRRRNKPPNWQSTVRVILQHHNPDSSRFGPMTEPLFCALGRGRWGLRSRRKI